MVYSDLIRFFLNWCLSLLYFLGSCYALSLLIYRFFHIIMDTMRQDVLIVANCLTVSFFQSVAMSLIKVL
jgi:hypothetical protein